MTKYKYNKAFLYCVCIIFLSHPALSADSINDDLMNLSLEELNTIEVTSVSRKPESLFRAAAAVSVLTSEDIKRSGATNIAEALRLVPGINVARIDSNKWAITARGFNRQFSNKLLVQIDGRSVYTPLFSGVYWDVQDLILEDIDRVEVIRGPGATMWGANAVNGIINIITKSAQETQGTYLSAIYGNFEKGTFEARHGGYIDDQTAYRVYGKRIARDESKVVATGNGNNDNWHQERLGFRVDRDFSLNEKARIQGDFYSGNEQQTYFLPGAFAPAVTSEVDGDETVLGANILANWSKTYSDGSENRFQAYLDYIQRDISNVLDQRRFTFDLDFQRTANLNERNNMVWGLGYRIFRDHLDENTFPLQQQYLDYEPEKSNNNLISAFIQNEFAVIPDKLFFTLGSKFSHNYFSDFEIQPNARLSWHATDTQTLWAAVSRAIRIPTRGERGLSSIALSTPGGFVRQSANTQRNYDSEKLMAYEMGYRTQPAKWASIDASAFYNEYRDLRTFETGVSGFNLPNTLFELVASNSGFAETYGAEISATVSPTKNWKIITSYSFLEMETHSKKGSDDFLIAAKEGQSPEQQITISSRYNVSEDLEIDTTVYYVDELPAYNIEDYTRLDLRLGWRLTPNSEISLVGQNLLNGYHQENRPSLYSRQAEIGRSVYGKIAFNF